MMRKVTRDEIHDLDWKTMISREEFMQHIPDKYVPFCNLFHHVDTDLREQENTWKNTTEKVWRLQGYLTKEDLWLLMANNSDYKISFFEPEYTGTFRFNKDTMEIWTMIIPYKE